ncbi:hypothetical protein ACLMAL_15540 [Nocardia sp. CWNU-33]
MLGIVSAQGVEQVFPGQPMHHFPVRRGTERSDGLDRDLLRVSFGFVVDQEGQDGQLFVDDIGNIPAMVVDHAQDADVLVGAAQHHRRRFFCPGEDPQEGSGIGQRMIGLGLDGWRRKGGWRAREGAQREVTRRLAVQWHEEVALQI